MNHSRIQYSKGGSAVARAMLLLLALFAPMHSAAAQVSASYSIDVDVLDGGGMNSSSTNYSADDAIAQDSGIGESWSGNYSLQSGMWNDAGGEMAPPSITLTAPAVPVVTNAALYVITWTAADPDSNPLITLYSDTTGTGYNGTQIPTGAIHLSDPRTYNWDVSGLADGMYYVYGVIDDGNKAVKAYAAGSLTIDRTGPIATITNAPIGITKQTSATLSIGGSDVVEYRYILDGDPLTAAAPVATPVTLSSLSDGIHFILVSGKDSAGNWQQNVTLAAWTVDATSPETAITGSPANPSYVNNASFSFGSEPAATFECKLDAGVFAACSSPVTYFGLADGSHTFGVRAGDTAGNIDQTPAQFTWTVDTKSVRDIIPDQFTFTPRTDVALNTVVTSNTITVTGINSPAPISITGGLYSVNGAAFTSMTSTITNGSTVTVKTASSPEPQTIKSTTLNIGVVSGTFSVMTVLKDTTPDAFSFASQTGVALNVLVTSSTATLTGINSAVAISVIGGSYSINGGAFTTAAGTAHSGDGMRVKVLSSIDYGTASNVSLTLGSVTTSFTATTLSVVNDSPASATDTLTADPALVWTTGGDGTWFGENAVYTTGGSAAQSGRIGANGTSWLQTQVTGTFTLSFFQKVSSQSSRDFLRFSIDGVEKGKISGNVNWQQKLYSVTTGTAGTVHTLRWTYTKDATISAGLDAGWVDSVRVSPYAKTAVVYPNGGETLHAGDPVLIQWHAQAQAEKFILYSMTDGLTWHPITPDYVTGSSFTWTDVPAVSSAKCKVKVASYSAAGKLLVSDASNAAFTIAP